VNGTLRVSGIERVEDLRTVNGNIEVYEGGGSVHAHTRTAMCTWNCCTFKTRWRNCGNHQRLAVAGGPCRHACRPRNAVPERKLFSELPVTFESTLKRARCTADWGGRRADPLHTVNGGIRLVALRSTV